MALLFGAASAHAADTGTRSELPSTKGYVVLYKPAVEQTGLATDRLQRRLNFDATREYRHAVNGFAARLTDEQAHVLGNDPTIAVVAPDRPLHALSEPIASGDSVPTGISRIGATTPGTARSASATSVAVVDSGIDLDHPDLNVTAGTNCADSGPPDDQNGHGSHVAGIIGARNNGSGVIGVAPGTRVIAVKVLDANGEGSDSAVICGIDWVTANARRLNIRVANLSLGGYGPRSTCASDALHYAICNSTAAGVTFTVAAGNDGMDIGLFPPSVPAVYPEVMTVTAMSDSDGRGGTAGPAPDCMEDETDDSFASFSSFATSAGDLSHTIAAPGVCINSTFRGGGYETASGTSMAAPHVAGTVALCFDEGGVAGPCSGLQPPQVIKKLRNDALSGGVANGFIGDPNRPVGSRYYGHLVSVPESTKPVPPPSPTPAPVASVAPDRSITLDVLSTKRRQRVHHLTVSAQLGEAGTLSASGVLRGSGFRYKRPSPQKKSQRVAAGERVRLTLPFARAALRRIKRDLRRGKSRSASITVTATDLAGNSAVAHLTVRLRP